jgi:hypothetical protein
MISVAALGIVLAVILYLENWTQNRMAVKAVAAEGAAAGSAEEELFND